jgi:hypothetical protein
VLLLPLALCCCLLLLLLLLLTLLFACCCIRPQTVPVCLVRCISGPAGSWHEA